LLLWQLRIFAAAAARPHPAKYANRVLREIARDLRPINRQHCGSPKKKIALKMAQSTSAPSWAVIEDVIE
jgi:hypothetical protein